MGFKDDVAALSTPLLGVSESFRGNALDLGLGKQ